MTAHVPSQRAGIAPQHATLQAFLAVVIAATILAIAVLLATNIRPATSPTTYDDWTARFPGKAADDRYARDWSERFPGKAADDRFAADWSVLFPGKAADDIAITR